MNPSVAEIDALILKITAEEGRGTSACLPLLTAIQKKYFYLRPEALERVYAHTDCTPSQVLSTASFYRSFRFTPAGKHLIKICVGTACHVAGAPVVITAVKRHLGIKETEDTDKDGLFTVEPVACLGCCSLAPVMVIDQITYPYMTAGNADKAIRDFLSRKTGSLSRAKGNLPVGENFPEIRIGMSSCCLANGSAEIFSKCETIISENNLHVRVKKTACTGMCSIDPYMEIVFPGSDPVIYTGITAASVPEILHKHFTLKLSERLKYKIVRCAAKIISESDENTTSRNPADPLIAGYLAPQNHIALEYSGLTDPLDLNEYREKHGFEAAKSCIGKMTPEEIISEIEKSGLRGRGGAGYPTGKKWRLVRSAPGEEKYLILNGDEGDPGAFMDRMLLESFPFRIIEGMLIAGYASGAGQGIVYIRGEYPLALERMRSAVKICLENNILGTSIFGSAFSFTIRIAEGAGAFICGEETALIKSLEGLRGFPSLRPPYPSEHGLFGKPTCINNAETIALVPWIFRKGSQQFASLGTGTSRGTKVFALAGKVNRSGLIEVPMGITIRDLVYKIGGGISGGGTFKAVQIGGPSGGCIPAELADTPIDYEQITECGAIMGSGGLVVLDHSDCMVDIARYFLSFTCDESCGKCTCCRIGTVRMRDILNDFCAGKAKPGDIERLESLAGQIKKGSLCGLGKTAPNPVISTLRYFRNEYEAHILGKCPALKCSALITYTVTDACIGCTRCHQVCPVGAIAFTPHEKAYIQDTCTKCGMCMKVCPEHAIMKVARSVGCVIDIKKDPA